MWKMIFFLWLVPLCLATVALARAARGTHLVRPQELRLFFGKSKQTTLSVWIWLGFVTLALCFFILGVVQAVILLNLSALWMVIAPFFTGALAVLFLILLLRAGSSRRQATRRRYQRASSPSHGNLFSP